METRMIFWEKLGTQSFSLEIRIFLTRVNRDVREIRKLKKEERDNRYEKYFARNFGRTCPTNYFGKFFSLNHRGCRFDPSPCPSRPPQHSWCHTNWHCFGWEVPSTNSGQSQFGCCGVLNKHNNICKKLGSNCVPSETRAFSSRAGEGSGASELFQREQ